MRENCRQTFRSLVTDNLVLYLISLYCCTTATGDAVLPDVQQPYQQQIQSQYQAEQITSNLFYLYFCPIKKNHFYFRIVTYGEVSFPFRELSLLLHL